MHPRICGHFQSLPRGCGLPIHDLPQIIVVPRVTPPSLVGKSARNSTEFHNYSDSGPFELQNFHWNFIFPIVKFVPANAEHVPAGSESSPTINSSDFMHWKTFLLYLFVASGIKILDSTDQCFLHAPSPITLTLSTQYTQINENLIVISRCWHHC
jgi:hypothetical protein